MSFHRFNAFTGRLRQATQCQALNPISPNPLQKTEALPRMMLGEVKAKTGASKQSYSTLPQKMIDFQKKCQVDIDAPSYLIRGTLDKITFGVTTALVAVGCIINGYDCYRLLKKF